jgi:hypothetical protein
LKVTIANCGVERCNRIILNGIRAELVEIVEHDPSSVSKSLILLSGVLPCCGPLVGRLPHRVGFLVVAQYEFEATSQSNLTTVKVEVPIKTSHGLLKSTDEERPIYHKLKFSKTIKVLNCLRMCSKDFFLTRYWVI